MKISVNSILNMKNVKNRLCGIVLHDDFPLSAINSIWVLFDCVARGCDRSPTNATNYLSREYFVHKIAPQKIASI